MVMNRLIYRLVMKDSFHSYHFKKIIVRYKKDWYNLVVFRQTACLVVNPIKVNINSEPLRLHDGRSDVRLNNSTILNLT